jgi:hypothetical protein
MLNVKKTLKALKTLVPKNSWRVCERYVHVSDKVIEFTNGFFLIQIPNTTGMLTGLYTKDQVESIPDDITAAEHPDIYPETSRVKPTGSPKCEVEINTHNLEQICKILKLQDPEQFATLSIHEDHVVLETANGSYGLIATLK